MSGNKKRLRGSSSNTKSKNKRVHGESSSRGEAGKEERWDLNVWLQWWTTKRKEKATKKARIQLAKDEKEFSRSKAVGAEEEDDSSDVPFDGLAYEDARLAFDREKSPKLDDLDLSKNKSRRKYIIVRDTSTSNLKPSKESVTVYLLATERCMHR
ncbi:hypothetical protein CTI12_AA372070 [Artemisia annua]|uniref:Uncharacterized protein n=1 Tax=Artemisia annua TaxID=35608 RepID=A0A2U1MJM5_ARTAN|nr:hypothetical protein CTI12_AA372070 [Artemisia annua]